ncbi:MAG: hypothetical protein M1115_04430 [Actinobacteria bacterium]|nr:hypothetical protein [Actinomycetota bacterium]
MSEVTATCWGAWCPPSAALRLLAGLTGLLSGLLASMLHLEDFVWLMVGKALRKDPTALAVGAKLLTAT